MTALIPKFLRWAFNRYNQRVIKPSLFEGEIIIPGLEHKVIIHRDKWHIPHIYAENRNDLFFAQGYVQAQDRIWALEMNRRTGQGKLAEAFGELALDTDRLTRTLGFNRLAKADWELMDKEHQIYLQFFSKGINAWLDNNKLPIEFKLTGIKPETWTHFDTLAWGRVMTWTLSHGWSGSLTRQAIIEKVGDKMAEELAIVYPMGNPVEIQAGVDINHLQADNMFKTAQGPFLAKDMEGGGRGSNAWVVSSRKTKTNRPILCNDTHLVLNCPGIWYLNHLHSNDGYHCTGSTITGLPGILLGHNEVIAWGITLAYTDVEDIFVEKLDVTDPEKYEYKGKSRKFEVVEEKISIKGKADHFEKIRYTTHGPLIGKVTDHRKMTIALCSKALEPSNIITGFLGINIAKNWNEFTKSIGLIKAPQLNFVYGDTDGNIGLYISGRVPIRNKGRGDLPVPGWTGEGDWIGEIPHEDMPHVLNPDCGYIISCNHKITGKDYPHYLGNSFMNGYRAKRIDDKFRETPKMGIDHMQALHMDLYSIPGKRLIEGLIKEFRTAKPKARKVMEVLENWDFQLSRETIGGTCYQILLYKLLRNIVEPHLGTDLTIRYLGMGEHPLLLPVNELLGHSTEALFQMFQNRNSKWVPSDKTAIAVIEKSLVETCKWLEDNLGYEPKAWEWGKIHQARFRHGLSIKKPLDDVFDVGPFPIGGDTDTVHQTAYNPNTPFHPSEWCPSNRFIFDIGEWDNSLTISPPGQSGVLGSKHYDDMAPLWYNGEYVPLLWSKAKVVKSSQFTLELNSN